MGPKLILRTILLSLTLSVAGNNSAFAALTDADLSRIYVDYLGRSPDKEGAAFWKASGVSEAELIANIVKTEEYKSQIGNLYRTLLQREPDEAGLNFYAASGLDLKRLTAEISSSPEAQKNRQAAEDAGGPRAGYFCDGIANPNEKRDCQNSKCHAEDGSLFGQNLLRNKKMMCPNNGCVLTKYKLPEVEPLWQGGDISRNTQFMNIPVYNCPKGTATTNQGLVLRFDGAHIAMVNGTVEEYLEWKAKRAGTKPVATVTPAPVPLEEAIKNVDKPSTPTPSLPAANPQQDAEFVNSIKSFAYKCLTAETPSSLCESLPKLVQLGYELMASEISETAHNASSVKYYTASKNNLQSNTVKSHSDIRGTAQASNQMKFEILRLAAPEVGRESLTYGKQNSTQLTQKKKKVLGTGLKAYSSIMNVSPLNVASILTTN